jgi:hypothetical protein
VTKATDRWRNLMKLGGQGDALGRGIGRFGRALRGKPDADVVRCPNCGWPNDVNPRHLPELQQPPPLTLSRLGPDAGVSVALAN